jgi:hypothetical protein
MATYDVVVQDRGGRQCNYRLHVQAASTSEAVMWARFSMPPQADDHLYAVYRHRRARRRKLVGYFAGPGGDDGSAGVREPRRPAPAPPSLRAEADPPAYPADVA